MLVLVAAIAVVVVVRHRFFYGKLLDPDDLSEEQEYRRCRRHLH